MTVSIEPLALAGACLMHRMVHRDNRGWFFESWREDLLAQAGFHEQFVQDNCARSTEGMLRGLHFQQRRPQGKLVFVVNGQIRDAIVDLRPQSETFGKSLTIDLVEGDGRALWVPPGFAHGYAVRSSVCDVMYKCTAFYDPGDEGGLRWDDPDLAIDWAVAEPHTSARDRNWPSFKAWCQLLDVTE